MRGIRVVTITLLAVGAAVNAAAVNAPVAAQAVDVDATLRAQLERVAQRRIFFGHQSVGNNLLDGLKQLALSAGVPVRIADVRAAGGAGPPTLEHAWVGENGKPLVKLQAFDQAMGAKRAGVQIALLKFCYLDITADTDAKALFAQYRATIENLRARNPGTVLVHVTTPLTTVQSGLKGFVKRLLGRAPYGALENVRRDEYNALLRQAYQGREPIFDLARVESTAADGAAATVNWKGRVAPALVPAYTDDGNHLNAAGRLRAARELVSVLAAVPDRPAAATASAR